jgi:hypothetical protein
MFSSHLAQLRKYQVKLAPRHVNFGLSGGARELLSS